MHVYAGLIEAGAEGEREKLILLKRRAHRDRAVIERDVVPAEEPLGGGDEAISERPTLQVDREHRAARHRMEVAKQLHHLVVGEVMQEKRAEDKIEAARGEGQQKRVGGQLGMRSVLQMNALAIERRDGSAWIAAQ